jgi:hypothetical protein
MKIQHPFGILSAICIILSMFLPFEWSMRVLVLAVVFSLWSNYWLIEHRS